MKLVKVFIFIIVFLGVWMVAPVEAFVLGNTGLPSAGNYSSANNSQHQDGFLIRPEASSAPDRSFYPYMQTRPRNFSSLSRLFNPRSKVFSSRYGGYSRASHHGGYTDLSTTPTQTPEPATLLLFGFGLAGAGIYRRLKN